MISSCERASIFILLFITLDIPYEQMAERNTIENLVQIDNNITLLIITFIIQQKDRRMYDKKQKIQ